MNGVQGSTICTRCEALARQLLGEDWESDSTTTLVDHLGENWAQSDSFFDLNQGTMAIEISDLQGRFNLNNLRKSDGTTNSKALSQFKRLLDLLGLPRAYATALQDWLDSDQLESGNGTEGRAYQTNALPYWPANDVMANVSELMLLNGMTIQDFQMLREHVTALPSATSVNLNSATGMVMRALAPDLSASQAERLVNRQDSDQIDNIDEFLTSSTGQAFKGVENTINTNSEYFLVDIMASYNARRSHLEVLLHRDAGTGEISIIYRSLMPQRELDTKFLE